MFKREMTFKGADIEYSGSNTTVERINCTQRIEDELVLQVNTSHHYIIIILLADPIRSFSWFQFISLD